METKDGEETLSGQPAGEVCRKPRAGAETPEVASCDAEAAGFINPNMVSMIKKGASKLPLDRVPALAKALECDPALLRLALEQSAGKTAATAIYEVIGPPITKHELAWIMEIRDASGDTDPRLTSRASAAIRGIFGREGCPQVPSYSIVSLLSMAGTNFDCLRLHPLRDSRKLR